MARKEKVVVAGEVGFVSINSSTPEKPRGTYLPLLETPRRSPRLAALKRKREQSCHADTMATSGKKPRSDAPKPQSLSTPTRDAIRRAVRGRGCTNLLNELQQVVIDQYRDKKVDVSITTAKANNELRRYLVVSRRTKAFDEDMGPHDSIKLVVQEDGKYKLSSLDKCLEEGMAKLPLAGSDLSQAIERLCNEKWIVSPGIKPYSTYKKSIGYDLKRVVMSEWPPDTARDYECTVFYEKSTTQKTPLCKKCVSLKWRLSARKMEHDQLTDEHRRQRQQSSSTVPFDFLSPESKLSNMRREIANLRSQAKCSAEKIERTSMNDKQNDEVSELVNSIDSSDHGQSALQSIFQEADKAGEGKGDIFRGIWEQDVSDMKQFYQDQKQNGEYIA